MKDSKGRSISEKTIERKLREWERRLEPLHLAVVRSEHFTADDFRITINAGVYPS